MKKGHFERLKESVIEAGRIMRGEIPPSRETLLEIETEELPEPIETWAVCIESDDAELLIPGKIYQVKQLSGGFWVRDEEGASTLCPQDFFMPIELPRAVSEKLENIKQAA
jgi:hypothetical protein